MIARRLRMNNDAKSNVLRLTDYLVSDQGVSCRVGAVNITNCESEDPTWAALEMLATQQQNTRAKGDKTYHLVLSFNEYPSEKILKQIEDEFCNTLGFKGHQRFSVMHDDTDNPHLHIVINKIHPEKLTMHEPYYDHKQLLKLCDKAERLYGLVPDNHIPKAEAVETAAKNMEQAGDLESLIGKIQRTCLQDMKTAQSWEEIHTILAKQGFEMRLRGNGLIISDGIVHVKASSVDRSLSKSRLEKRLGDFAGSKIAKTTSQYAVKPIERPGASKLWSEYQQWIELNDHKRKAALQKARAALDIEIEKARNSSDFSGLVISNFVEGAVFKRILHAQNRRRLRKQAAAAQKAYRNKKAAIFDVYKYRTWGNWLTQQATEGNSEALSLLRSKQASDRVMANTISGQAGITPKVPQMRPVKVTGQGTYVFEQGTKQNARHLRVQPNASDEALKEGLEVATQSYGQVLKVDGTEDFKNRILRMVVEQQLPVRFEDLAMEKLRQAALAAQQNDNTRRQGRR